ncbi:MAG: hypothetical protein ACUVX9_13250, partial [Anaerolineae bacterium]
PERPEIWRGPGGPPAARPPPPAGAPAGAPPQRFALGIVVFLLLYTGLITLSAKKYDRYTLPALLALDLLAALGWLALFELVLRRHPTGSDRSPGAPAGLVSALLAIQSLLLLAPLFPAHYLAYFNPLLGGAPRAVQALPVGLGEGVEQAAAYLAAQPDARERTVATLAVAGVAPLYPGSVLPLGPETVPAADYVLLYVGDVQQASPLAQAFYGRQDPEYVVRLNGIEYAWVYRNTYCKALRADIERDARPGDVVIANAASICERHIGGPALWVVADATAEEAVAVQLQQLAGASERILYLEFAGLPRAPGIWLRRQLAQAALLLWEKPFAFGTLSCYQRPAGSQFHVTEPTLPTGAQIGPLRLERTGLWGSFVQYRQEVGVGLEWQPVEPVAQDLHYSLRLVDAKGRLWGQRDGPLENDAFHRTSTWPQGGAQRCQLAVPLVPGIPPGRYEVRLAVYGLQDQAPLPVTGPDGQARGFEYRLGEVEVISAAVPPSMADLAIAHTTDLALGDRLQIIGCTAPEGAVESGEDAELSLYWRCLRPPSERYRLDLRLVRDGAVVAAQRFDPAGPDYPTDRWSPGEVIRYFYRLAIPASAATGEYALSAGLYTLDGRQVASDVPLPLTLHVEHLERLFSAPPIRYPLEAELGEQIRLLGYDLAETAAQPGAVLHLTLYWQALRRPERDYTVFVHLLDAQGAVRGQHDSAPLNGRRPTTGWVPGEVLVDTYDIPVAANAAPGPHRLEIGLYYPASGARLPVTRGGQPTGDERVLLPTEVTVGS